MMKFSFEGVSDDSLNEWKETLKESKILKFMI